MQTSWDLFREMDAIRQEFDRVFRDAGFERGGLPLGRFSFLPAQSARTYPLTNVSEDETTVYVDALAPGLEPSSLSLNVVRNQLQITGHKPGNDASVDPAAYHRSERAAARFARTVTLPAEVDSDEANARYRNGILRISLPKSEAAKPRQIQVTVS